MSTENTNVDAQKDDVLGFDELFAQAVASDGTEDTEDAGTTDDGGNNVDTGDTDVSGDAAPAKQDSQENVDQIDYRALYEQEQQRVRSWDGRLSAKDREIRALQEELERIKQSAQKNETADDGEEDESVKAFLEEFPELAAPIQKMIEKVAKKHGKSVAEEITSKVEGRLAPIAQTVQETTVQKHLSTIRATHEDFEQIVQSGDLQEWIKSQPRYMQPALQEVYERGYAEDVVDLLSQYKQARGITSGSSGSTSQVTQPNTNNTAKRPPAAVKSRHSAPPARAEKIAEDDFDAAWQAALRSK